MLTSVFPGLIKALSLVFRWPMQARMRSRFEDLGALLIEGLKKGGRLWHHHIP
jgi:hypothetical protein